MSLSGSTPEATFDSTLETTLMIRVVALSGSVPVEAFLRAARDLAYTAAEVGRTSTTLDKGDLTLLDDDVMAPSGMTSEAMPPGWHIVDAQYSGPAESLLSEGAPAGRHAVALVIAPPAAQRQAARQVREGIALIQGRCEIRPPGFTDAALRSLRRVAALSMRQLRVSVSAGRGAGEAVELGSETVAQIDTWLAGQRDALGSVEGTLEIISIHNRLRFTIYERRPGAGRSNGAEATRIECLFPEALLPKIKMALGERVCIRGRVRYRRDGIPATVDAQWLRVLAPLAELPSIEAMIGSAFQSSTADRT